jgi:transcriptional regulator with XRE-family HTH domain
MTKENSMLDQHQQRLQELGDFLRTRRARLAPEEVGFTRGSRRKTPGLKREEVAQLVGVSIDWYTRLEQGRPMTPSTQILERLVQTLRLDADERTHLFFLTQQQSPPTMLMAPETTSPALQHYLDHLGHNPAFVTNRQWDVVAWNEAACTVFLHDFCLTPAGEQYNMVWRFFTWPLARQLIVDWEGHARRILAEFRASYARYLGDQRLTALVHDLMLHSSEFRTWWLDHEVLGAPEGHKTINHPHIGHLMFEHLAFQVFDAPELKVTVYTPLEEADTPRKLDRLLNLNQWCYNEKQGCQLSETARKFTRAQRSEQDSVTLWLETCCEKTDGNWVANSHVMTSYTNWCKAHGYEPKRAKGLAQSLAAHGMEISVRSWVYTGLGKRTKMRGVRGLSIQHRT